MQNLFAIHKAMHCMHMVRMYTRFVRTRPEDKARVRIKWANKYR
jgi:hypothetical protein